MLDIMNIIDKRYEELAEEFENLIDSEGPSEKTGEIITRLDEVDELSAIIRAEAALSARKFATTPRRHREWITVGEVSKMLANNGFNPDEYDLRAIVKGAEVHLNNLRNAGVDVEDQPTAEDLMWKNIIHYFEDYGIETEGNK